MSSDHILTSHVGSLPRPDDLIEANRAREAGETTDEPAFQGKLRAAVRDVVRHQRELGIDIPVTANSANRWGTASITARGSATASTVWAGSI